MRLPLNVLGCALLAAACSTERPAENPGTASVERNDATVTPTDSEPSPAPLEDTPTRRTTDADDAARRRDVATAPATIGEPEPEAARTTPPARNDSAAAADSAKPDNTKVNKRDTNSAAMTPLDQGENAADLKLTQQIRQAVMADGTLSFTAKNVKIITLNKKVTLRGPVKSAAERASIESAARKIAGASMVDNQLEVAP